MHAGETFLVYLVKAQVALATRVYVCIVHHNSPCKIIKKDECYNRNISDRVHGARLS